MARGIGPGDDEKDGEKSDSELAADEKAFKDEQATLDQVLRES